MLVAGARTLARRRAALSAAAACCSSGFHSASPAPSSSSSASSSASKVASSPLANWAIPAAAAAAFLGWATFQKGEDETKEKKKEEPTTKDDSAAKCEEAPPSLPPHPPPRRPDLPLYKRADVARHNKPGDVWVTRGDGVYDVTEFVAGHPGGPARLMLAAGGAIDPFWAMYAQHDTGQVREILEGYRVGTLVSEKVEGEKEEREKDLLLLFFDSFDRSFSLFISTPTSTLVSKYRTHARLRERPPRRPQTSTTPTAPTRRATRPSASSPRSRSTARRPPRPSRAAP
jgi:cytochrome b involved in lipid metabolism